MIVGDSKDLAAFHDVDITAAKPNYAEATASPWQVVQVLSPAGLEKLEQGQQVLGGPLERGGTEFRSHHRRLEDVR